MKRIISIQHCESIHHKNGMIGSWTDWELNENGITQAHNIGKKLQDELNEEYVIYTSDLKRATMTASIVGEYLNATPKIDPRLKELNLGIACGQTTKWFKENCNPSSFDVNHVYIEGSETLRDHYNRVKSFIDEILQNDEENIILVSHGGTVSVLHMIIMGLPIETMNTVRVHSGAGTISKYVINEEITRVHAIGDTSYRE